MICGRFKKALFKKMFQTWWFGNETLKATQAQCDGETFPKKAKFETFQSRIRISGLITRKLISTVGKTWN